MHLTNNLLTAHSGEWLDLPPIAALLLSDLMSYEPKCC